MNSVQIFQYIFDQIETPLLMSVASIVTSLVAYASAPVQMALVIYIALTGVMVMRGSGGEGMSGLVGRVVKLSLVAWFATNGSVYAQWRLWLKCSGIVLRQDREYDTKIQAIRATSNHGLGKTRNAPPNEGGGAGRAWSTMPQAPSAATSPGEA